MNRLDQMVFKVAVLIPCYNEESTIARVVDEFRTILPNATIYVYDNNSTDKTIEVAKAAGALVRCEKAQGKGSVVRRMFSDIEADAYLMVDGDATYHAESAPKMLKMLVDEQLDMVVGSRDEFEVSSYRRGHRFGNAFLTKFVSHLFGKQFTDMLSGYRVFSRAFVKSFPASSKGFEIETELTIHALELSMPVDELSTPYGARPEGSNSKLRTYVDGFKILSLITVLYRNEKPLQFFSLISIVFAGLAMFLAAPLFQTYLETGQVPRLPTAVLSTGLMILAFLTATCGFILDTVTRGRKELKRFVYLTVPKGLQG